MNATPPDTGDKGAAPAASDLHIGDECATLQAVIGFAPGDELDRMIPRHIEPAIEAPGGGLRANPDYLLFDDLVLLDTLKAEHCGLFDVIQAVVGPRHCHDLRRMLQRILLKADVRQHIVQGVAQLERQFCGRDLADGDRDLLLELPPDLAAEALLSGYDPESGLQLLAWPMPNWLFTRDCFAVVGESVILGRPRHPARQRDGLLARAIVRHHRVLCDADHIDVAALLPPGADAWVEGGDVLVVGADIALIGIGIRTSAAAAAALAGALRERGFAHVLGVHLPRTRAAMHLDTLFTLIDHDACLLYAAAFSEASEPAERVEVVALDGTGRALGCDLSAILGRLGKPLQIVACGDGDRIVAAREQWTDGANAFCLGPGRIILYARNQGTLRALNRAGFEILTPAEFIRNAPLLMAGQRRFVVAVSGFELSRGRGGPRCLTLPVRRAR